MKKAFLAPFAIALAGLIFPGVAKQSDAREPIDPIRNDDAQASRLDLPRLPASMQPGSQEFVLKRAVDGSTMAYHRSHYSHQSHSSHRSHYSGS